VKKLWSTRDIAKEYGVSIKTVWAWIDQGRFPNAFQINVTSGLGSIWLVPDSDLDDFEKPGAPGVGRPRKEKENDVPADEANEDNP